MTSGEGWSRMRTYLREGYDGQEGDCGEVERLRYHVNVGKTTYRRILVCTRWAWQSARPTRDQITISSC